MCLLLSSGVAGDVRNMNMSGVVGAAPLGRKQDRGVACRVGVRVRVRRCGSGTCDLLLRRDAAAATTDAEKPTWFWQRREILAANSRRVIPKTIKKRDAQVKSIQSQFIDLASSPPCRPVPFSHTLHPRIASSASFVIAAGWRARPPAPGRVRRCKTLHSGRAGDAREIAALSRDCVAWYLGMCVCWCGG
jgi:hypothetical protein